MTMTMSSSQELKPPHTTSQMSQAESSPVAKTGADEKTAVQPHVQPQLPPPHQLSLVSRPGGGPAALQFSAAHPPSGAAGAKKPPGGGRVEHIYHIVTVSAAGGGAAAMTPGGGGTAPQRQQGNTTGFNPQGKMVMAPTNATTSNTERDEDKPVEPSKRRLRLDSNRESARRSRQKKKNYVDTLEEENKRLKEQIEKLRKKCSLLENYCRELNFLTDVPYGRQPF